MPKLLILSCFFLSTSCFSQIRLSALVLKPKESFRIINSDILVLDTLVMADSSNIILDEFSKENFIHVKWAKIGYRCTIDGSGKNGLKGMPGRHGLNGNSLCANGRDGKNGENGSAGEDGKNLSLYLNEIMINGSLIVYLQGGDGGNGGDGGDGGNGSPKSKNCTGGSGGNAGNAGNGGDGGKGGTLSVFGERELDLFAFSKNLVCVNLGGKMGLGGKRGFAGKTGYDPTKDDILKHNGNSGENGVRGIQGSLIIEIK
jgi:hypothetical protein